MYKFLVSHTVRALPAPRRAPKSRIAFAGALLSLGLLTSSLSSTAFAAEGDAAPPSKAAPTTKAAPAPTKAATTQAPATPEAKTTKAAPEAKEGEAESEATGAEASAETTEAPAPTEAEREEARVAFEAGTKAFEEGNFAQAVTNFEAAYAKVPSPHVEYWIAKAKDEADPENKDAKALVDAYAKFLTNPGASHAGAERVTEAEARIVELKKLLPAQVTLTTVPEGASVIIDGQAQDGVTPLSVELPAGAHKIEIALEGFESAMVELDLEGGSTVEQEVQLTKVEPPPAPVEEPPPAVEPVVQQRSVVPAAVTLGLGGAGLISGTLFGIMALGAKKDFNDNPTTENADTAERNALIADMSFGIALTLGITGIVLLTADEDGEVAKSVKNSRVQVAPYASKKGGGLAGRFSF